MTVLRAALTASRLLSEDPAWRLLRANNAAIAVAVLSKHLGGEQRRLAAPALFEHVEGDLEEPGDFSSKRLIRGSQQTLR